MPDQGPELRDVHVPDVSMWWPLAPGWWIVLGVIVIAAIALVVLLRRRRAWRARVERALDSLRDARARHAQDGNVAAFAATTHELLRRVARTRDPRSVSLRGEAWRDALASMAPRVDVAQLATLETAMYRPAAALDVDGVAHDAESWVRAALRRDALHASRGRAVVHASS
jgi:hypothetical protein